jgi:glutathione synthase/RimK-type ligase-like ATP-grasp enzyme
VPAVILLWGLSGDDPLDDVARELRRTRQPHVWIDQRAVLATHVDLDASGCAGWVDTPAAGIALGDITALYIRGYDAHQLPAVREGGDEARTHVRSVDARLWCFADVAPILVLNRPTAMNSNNSKPYQAQLIRDSFLVPQTLVTTDPDAARAFWDRHGAVVYKSVSGQRSIVTRLSPDDSGRLDDLRWCPTQLQEYVPGRDYRVHVVDRQVFATEVLSSADDYRYAARQGTDVALRAVELPDDVVERAIGLADALNLPLAGIDLRRATNGAWYCFEVNPSPCFSYYESHTGQPITAAVAALLAGATHQ